MVVPLLSSTTWLNRSRCSDSGALVGFFIGLSGHGISSPTYLLIYLALYLQRLRPAAVVYLVHLPVVLLVVWRILSYLFSPKRKGDVTQLDCVTPS